MQIFQTHFIFCQLIALSKFLLMAKANNLTVFECGKIVELHQPDRTEKSLRTIRMAVRQETWWSPTQVKATTGADCSPIIIRRHWQGKGFKNKNTFKGPHLLQCTCQTGMQSCQFGLCKKGAPNVGHTKVENSFILWWGKMTSMASNIIGRTQRRDATWSNSNWERLGMDGRASLRQWTSV